MDCGEALSQDPVNGPPDPGFALDDHEPALAVTGVIERPAQGLELCVTIEGRLRGLAGHALGPILFESGRGIRALRSSSARRMQDASAVPSSRPLVETSGVRRRPGRRQPRRGITGWAPCLQADAVVCAHARETPATDEDQRVRRRRIGSCLASASVESGSDRFAIAFHARGNSRRPSSDGERAAALAGGAD